MTTPPNIDPVAEEDATQTLARIHSGPEPRASRSSTSGRDDRPASSGASWSGVRRAPTPASHDGPATIGRFLILDQIASGGMGELFLGWDGQLDRKVAIKLVRTRKRTALTEERLRREAKVLAQLSHPNVVPVFDVGEFEGRVFVAMEFVEGRTLRTYVRALELRGGERVAEIVRRYVEAGRGLEAVHAAGLAHRDFKPENVIVGGDDRVRIVDFGLARVLDEGEQEPEHEGRSVAGVGRSPPEPEPGPEAEADDSMLSTAPLTETGALLGTPRYMAPEQWQGLRGDSRSDQFSFCVALFEALYDARPFEAPNLDALAEVVTRGHLSPPPRRGEVPARIRDALLRGLSPDPTRRFASMAELLEALEPRPLDRRRRLIAALIAGALLVFGVSAGLGAQRGQAAGELSPFEASRRELAAHAHLERVEAQIEALEQVGSRAEADAAFAAFAELPEHAGTLALGRGWLAQARRLERRGELEAELDAYAAAYLSSSASVQREALLGLAAAFARIRQWQRLSGTLDAIEARRDQLEPDQAAALRRMRVAALAARRDLVGAAQVLEPVGDPNSDEDRWSATMRAALRELSRTTVTEHLVLGANLESFALAGVDLDGDELGELALVREGERVISLLGTADPALPLLAQLELGDASTEPEDLQVLRGAAEPLLGVREAERASVVRVVRAADDPSRLALERVLGLEQGGTQQPWWASADLDGDGRDELYLGNKPQRRLLAFEPDAAGRWRSGDPHVPTTLTNSVVHAVAQGDIDGDGGLELVALVGEWSAYDLRIFRAAPGPADPPRLELVARRKLGAVHGLELIPAGRGPGMWIAVGAVDDYPSRRVFPADATSGTPGTHVFAWDGEALAPIASLAQLRPTRIFAGDFDGNGLHDLALAIRRQPRYETTIVLQTAPGRFEPLTITQLWPIGVVDRDRDGDDELLAIDANLDVDEVRPRGRLFVLGSGEARLPALAVQGSRLALRPRITSQRGDGGVDESLAGAIDRAEDLARIGLPLRAAAQLRELAGVAPPQLAARLSLRAAELFDASGHRLAAAELYARAAADPRALGDAHGPARVRATQLYAELHRFAQASYMAEAALASTTSPQLRAELERELARLRALSDDEDALVFDFESPLDDRWAIDPLAVRHRHGRLELELGGPEQGVVARRELVWRGGRLALEVELDASVVEWGSGVSVALVPLAEPDAAPLELGVSAWGGGGIYELRLDCVSGGVFEPGDRELSLAHPHAELPEDQRHFVLAAEFVPELGRRWCRADHGRVRIEAPREGELAPGRYELRIRGSSDPWSRASASIDRIAIVGARDPDDLSGPIAEFGALGRELAGGRAESVLTALDHAPGLGSTSRERALLRFLALDELGRLDDAELALADALELPRGRTANDCRTSASTRTLVGALLRHRPERLGPALRRLCRADDYFSILFEVWHTAAHQHPESATIERLLITQTTGLERWLPSSPEDRLAALILLRMRAQAWSAQAADGAARAELERAVELGARWVAELDDADPAIQQLRAQLETELGHCRTGLAAELLDRGDEARALATLRAALERSPTPEILADMLTIDERFARIRDRPVWRELVEPALGIR